MATVKISGALSPYHLAVIKEDGMHYARTFVKEDMLMDDGAGISGDMLRAALLTKWGFARVIGERGEDMPEADENDAVIVIPKTLDDGEEVFQIVERVPPDPDDLMPWQIRPDIFLASRAEVQ